MKELILASRSPRRRELLQKCGIPFTADAADLDETINPGNPLQEEIQALSFRKAEAVLKRHPDAIIIGSDTTVTIHGEVLGKPHDHEDAKRMLRELSGTTHEVITGLCILSDRRNYQTVTVNQVSFFPLSEEEISSYVESGEADDKAGAYGIQGLAARYVKSIEGDFYSIMGLPVSLVYEELKNRNSY